MYYQHVQKIRISFDYLEINLVFRLSVEDTKLMCDNPTSLCNADSKKKPNEGESVIVLRTVVKVY